MFDTNAVMWGVIIFLDAFSILIGLNAGYKFVQAFIQGKNLLRYKGYFITAVILIFLMPLLITQFTPSILNLSKSISIVNVKPILADGISDNEKIFLKNSEFFVSSNELNQFDLLIHNNDLNEKEYLLDITCQESLQKCERGEYLITFKSESFNIPALSEFELPIYVNVSENIVDKHFSYMISVKLLNGDTYTKIPIEISIEE